MRGRCARTLPTGRDVPAMAPDWRRLVLTFLPCILAVGGPCIAAEPAPTAIVEEVGPGVEGVQMLEYLAPGRAIRLGETGEIVIGYLTSCVREDVTGGTVIIGTGESAVELGTVVRERVQCNGGGAQLTQAQREESGVSTWRKGDAEQPLRVYSLTPMLTFAAPPAHVVIERTDFPAAPIEVAKPGRILDLAEHGKALARGGRYTVRAAGRSQEIVVDAAARAHGGPVVGRLIRF